MNNCLLSSIQLSELRSKHRTLREKRDADRIKVVLLLGTGWSVSQVSEAQEAFLEEYKKLKENKGEADEILFMDATHPHYNPVVACG